MFLVKILRKLRILRKSSLRSRHKTVSDKCTKLVDKNISYCEENEERYLQVQAIGKLDETHATTSQSSLKDLIAIAEMEIKNEKHMAASEIDSCYNSSSDDDEIEDLYEEMNFNFPGNQSDLYMSMVFRKC